MAKCSGVSSSPPEYGLDAVDHNSIIIRTWS